VNADGPNERLIAALTADLPPVRRLPAPILRALVWLAIVVAIAGALAVFCDVGAVGRRLRASPDVWIAAAGSALTAVLAVIAAFELNLPDRKPLWALLPLPAALLWVVASGIGCLRSWFIADTRPAPLAETGDCLAFIVGLSIPLAAVLIVMLRRGYSLHPNLTLLVGGLACAAAAATLLNFFHPYDATATDLTVHAFAVAIVILATRFFGGRMLADKKALAPL
jgi:hypothetical protein